VAACVAFYTLKKCCAPIQPPAADTLLEGATLFDPLLSSSFGWTGVQHTVFNALANAPRGLRPRGCDKARLSPALFVFDAPAPKKAAGHGHFTRH
jgi:hypothetical protein